MSKSNKKSKRMTKRGTPKKKNSNISLRPEFPLYDHLADKASKVEIKWDPVLEKCVCSTLTALSKDHAEMVFAIIFHHALLNGHKVDKRKRIPYGGKNAVQNIAAIIELKKIPEELQNIIFVYLMEVAGKPPCEF